jgi:hypothetical protein
MTSRRWTSLSRISGTVSSDQSDAKAIVVLALRDADGEQISAFRVMSQPGDSPSE